MRYEGNIYRPPSEANSLLIQATIGCPHNQCTFCVPYKGTKFRFRPVEDILEDLRAAREVYGPEVRTLFLPDGNTIFMPTNELIAVLNLARELFPNLERVTVYGSARFILMKSPEELKAIKEAGLTRIHCGMETGDEELLKEIKKGVTPQELIEAGRRLKVAGIEVSEYVLMGIGGEARSARHAKASAEVLTAINPDFIRIRTVIPRPGTPFYEQVKKGEFTLMKPRQILEEIKLFVENLEVTSQVYSDHVSNYWNIQGQMPEDKNKMLANIDKALSLDDDLLEKSSFRGE